MNPFAQALRRRLRDRDLRLLLECWDRLEELVITAFRGEGDPQQDQQTWRQTRSEFLKAYPQWEADLEDYWRSSHIDGKPAGSDPFRHILAYRSIDAFKDNWRAMQTLPAAREALNLFVLDRIER